MKFSAVVLLLLIYLESHFQYFAQVQNLAPDLTPQEPSGNPAEFPNNTHPSRKNNKSSSENPKKWKPVSDSRRYKNGFGIDILQSERELVFTGPDALAFERGFRPEPKIKSSGPVFVE